MATARPHTSIAKIFRRHWVSSSLPFKCKAVMDDATSTNSRHGEPVGRRSALKGLQKPCEQPKRLAEKPALKPDSQRPGCVDGGGSFPASRPIPSDLQGSRGSPPPGEPGGSHAVLRPQQDLTGGARLEFRIPSPHGVSGARAALQVCRPSQDDRRPHSTCTACPSWNTRLTSRAIVRRHTDLRCGSPRLSYRGTGQFGQACAALAIAHRGS